MIFKIQKQSAQPVNQMVYKQPLTKDPSLYTGGQTPSLGGYTPLPYDYNLDPILSGGGGGTYDMTGGLLSLLEESEAEESMKAMRGQVPQMIQAQPQILQTPQQQQTQASSNIDQEKILFLIFGAFIGYALTKLL